MVKKKTKDDEDEKSTEIESRIEYTGQSFWLTVSSPKLGESKSTFKELYTKIKRESKSKKQKYYG